MIPVADNLQVIRPSIRRAIDRQDPEPIAALVRRMATAGAEAVDINTGPCPRNPEGIASFLVGTVQEACSLRVLIDSANPKVLEAGLRASAGTAILNGFSLEPQKLEQILPLAVEADADIVGYLLDADGKVPKDAQGRLAAALALLEAAGKRGLSWNRLLIDPIVAPLGWQDGAEQAREVVETVRLLPDLAGTPIRTIAGLSNLTAGAPAGARRQTLESAFAAMLSAAGLHMVLLDVFHPLTMEAVRACRMLTSGRVFSWAALFAARPAKERQVSSSPAGQEASGRTMK